MNKARVLWELYRFPHFVYDDARHAEALREKRLRRLLLYCWDHSAYYYDTWQRAGLTRESLRTCPLTALPAIDKQLLMANYERIVTDRRLTQEALREFAEADSSGLYAGEYHVVHSSGSTGTPRYFAYDRKAWEAAQCGIIRGALFGMRFREILRLLRRGPRILYIAATDGRYAGSMAIGEGTASVGGNSLYLDINTPLAEWPERINAFRPNIIIGYPSAVKILGMLMEQGAVRLQPERVITCGEPLPPALRNWLERCFGTTVVNFYGASESLCIGAEADGSLGLALFDDMNWVEVVDGEMYLTGLTNYAQPLVRYHMTDKLTLKPGRASCTVAELLLGRSEDLMWFQSPDGRREFLHPLAVEGFCVEGLLDYRFVQTAPDSFMMEAEISPESRREPVILEMRSQLRRLLKEKRLDWVRFEVQAVPCIGPDHRTGKKRLIVPLTEEKQLNKR